MDHQVFVERILENEGLTGDLEDGPAARLLQWGTGQVQGLVQDLADEEAAGDKVNGLVALMRQVTRTASRSLGAANSDLIEDLGQLRERYGQVFGPVRPASSGEIEAAATALAALSPEQAVTFVLDWLTTK